MSKATQSTQQFVDIKDIQSGTIYLKSGGLRKVLMVNGINFDLKSEDEQKIILGSFQNFLNTLDFPVQFFIHSRKVNVSSYLERIRARKDEEPNELLKIQIGEYIEFVRSFVEQNPIITKNFFVVVPYSPSAAVEKAAKGFLGKILKGNQSKKNETESASAVIQQLIYRVNQVKEGLENIGLRVSILGDEELTELFYNLYNPELTEKKGEEIPQLK